MPNEISQRESDMQQRMYAAEAKYESLDARVFLLNNVSVEILGSKNIRDKALAARLLNKITEILKPYR